MVRSTLKSSKFIQCFNQKNFSHEIHGCESLEESIFDVKHVNTMKSKT